MPLETLTAIFGWMSVINIVFLLFAASLMLALKNRVTGLHARMFDIDAAATRLVWYRWLGNYKIVTLTFSLVPYIAMRLAA